MDSGSLVSRFLTGQLRNFIGVYKIISRVKCLYNLIVLYFFVEKGREGKGKGREGEGRESPNSLPLPFRTLAAQAIFGFIMTFMRVARGFFNPVIPTQISA